MSERAVYAYCIIAEAPPNALEDAPLGVPGASAPRRLSISHGLDLVVADVEARAWSEAAISDGLRDLDWVSERAIRHEEVIAHFLECATVLPMKAFTLFRSDERAREHMRDREREVRAALDRVEGCVEWGVRFRFDETAARVAAERASRVEKPSSGAAFLARKKGLVEASRNARSSAHEAVAPAIQRLSAAARGTLEIPPPQGVPSGLLAELALLVPRDARVGLERTADTLRPELAARGVELELTGPWAPFHFASDRAAKGGAS